MVFGTIGHKLPFSKLLTVTYKKNGNCEGCGRKKQQMHPGGDGSSCEHCFKRDKLHPQSKDPAWQCSSCKRCRFSPCAVITSHVCNHLFFLPTASDWCFVPVAEMPSPSLAPPNLGRPTFDLAAELCLHPTSTMDRSHKTYLELVEKGRGLGIEWLHLSLL